MDKKLIIIPAFIIIVLLQWFVPAKMIWDSEEVLQSGMEYKFKTAPVDPYDPFRGKYVTLRYNENTYDVDNPEDWERGDNVYVLLNSDQEGFARIASVSKEKPTEISHYVKAKVQRVYLNKIYSSRNDRITIDYPFNRFYMEESKAYDAELLQRNVRRDTSRTTYALVSIKDGEAVIKDLMINDTSIVELVKIKQLQDEIDNAVKALQE